MTSRDPGDATVTLLVFSGRPDPEWTLDAERARELAELVARVVEGETTEPAPPVLGYRGFLVDFADAVRAPAHVQVGRGVVTELAGPRSRTWRDDGGVEEWLLEDARARGHAELIDAARGRGA